MGKPTESELKPLAITIERAVELSGFSRSRIYNSLRTGALPSFKIGKRRLIKYAALEQYVNELSEGA